MMATNAENITRTLTAAIDRAEADLAALAAQLSDAEKAAEGQPDRWAMKDQLAHLNFWRGYALRRLTALRDGEPVPEPIEEDDDVVNGRVFLQQRHTPWSALMAESDRIFRESRQVVAQIPERLAEPHESAPNGEFTRADQFVASMLEHPAEHLTQIYRDRGDTAHAEEMERATVETLRAQSAQGWATYGYALYNLGCIYAGQGDSARAIAALREAIQVVPSLAADAQDDDNLASLRDLPAFQSLTA